MRPVEQTLPLQTLFSKVDEETCSKAPELAVTKYLDQMCWSKRATQDFQLSNEMILHDEIWLERVSDETSIDQITPRFRKVRDACRGQRADKFLMVNLFDQSGANRRMHLHRVADE